MTVINASAAEFFFSGLCSSSVAAALALIKNCNYKRVSFVLLASLREEIIILKINC